MLEDENTLYIYTDGSTYYNPRRSGVGILFVYVADNGKERIYELDESGYKGGTINEMEIMACVIALSEAAKNKLFTQYKNIIIYSDSLFVINNYTRAEHIWSKNGWKLKSGAPVANTSAWKEFVKAKRKLGKPVEIHKVKAHSRNIHNNRVDKLAKKSAKIPMKKSLLPVQVTRKYSKRYTEKGSVKIAGQILKIRIIQRQYFQEQKIDRYRYEVVDQESTFFEYVDFIYSEFHLKRSHCYEVRVNSNQDFPQVIEVLQEIEYKNAVEIKEDKS